MSQKQKKTDLLLMHLNAMLQKYCEIFAVYTKDFVFSRQSKLVVLKYDEKFKYMQLKCPKYWTIHTIILNLNQT